MGEVPAAGGAGMILPFGARVRLRATGERLVVFSRSSSAGEPRYTLIDATGLLRVVPAAAVLRD